MFFISRGTVRVSVALGQHDRRGRGEEDEKYIISLTDGSFFGEVALLQQVR